MKKLLFVFVLLIFPFQMTWAVVDAYCQTEQPLTGQACIDCAQSLATADAQNEHQNDPSLAVDLDCSHCGVNGAAIVGVDSILTIPASNSATESLDPGFRVLITSQRPERPQWPDLLT